MCNIKTNPLKFQFIFEKDFLFKNNIDLDPMKREPFYTESDLLETGHSHAVFHAYTNKKDSVVLISRRFMVQILYVHTVLVSIQFTNIKVMPYMCHVFDKL